MKPYTQDKSFKDLTKLQKLRHHYDYLKTLERQGKNVGGLVKSYQSKIELYEKYNRLKTN